MQQKLFRTGPVWTLDLDIACEDPPALKHVDSSMYMRIANDRDSIILLFRVTDLDDDGKGELRFRVGTNDEQEWTVLKNVVVFDDDVQKRPLVHHLRIKGHFDGVDPYCEVILIDPVGVVHRARGTGKFADSVRTAVSPAVIRFDTAPNTADHLLDNVRFSVPDQTNKHLAPDRFISVGRTGFLKAACLPDADADLGEEGYVIAQRGDNLFLIGGTSRGPINAVFSLLEEDLGCRWYTSTRCASASAITRIPRRPALSFRPISRRYVPGFIQREPYYTTAWDGTWSLRNRTNANNVGIPEQWGGTFSYALHAHSFGNLLPPAEYFEEHPEYFMAEEDGRRIPRQLCATNPDVVRIVTKNVIELLKKRPAAELIMLSYSDGQRHCRCGPCMVLNVSNNSPNGSLITFVNQVAEAVEQEFPNVLNGSEAYNETMPAPTQVRPRHNVIIRICNSLHEWRYPLTSFSTDERFLSQKFRDHFAKWASMCDHLQVWDYAANHSHFLAPLPNMHTFGPDMRFYAKHNARGIFMQGIPRVPGGTRSPMCAWVVAKLMWDPSRDTRELEQDFIWGTWGNVAPSMTAYYELLADLVNIDQYPVGGSRYEMTESFITANFLKEATRLFDQAENMAESEQMHRRVEQARLPVMYTQLMRGPDEVGDEYPALIDRFASIADREGIRWLGMHSGTMQLDMKVEQWHQAWTDYQVMHGLKDGEYEIIPLSNRWCFAIDPEDRGLSEKWQDVTIDDDGWSIHRSDLNRGWEKQGYRDYKGLAWYRATLPPRADLRHQHLYIYFTAVGEEAWIYVDGEQVSEHTRVSTGLSARQLHRQPFMVDITRCAGDGNSHVLALRVHSEWKLGVWLPVYLVATDTPMEASLTSLLLRRAESSPADATAGNRSALEREKLDLMDLRKRQASGEFKANPYMHWVIESLERALTAKINERDWPTGE